MFRFLFFRCDVIIWVVFISSRGVFMIYVITGPTGVGKTKLSVAIAKELNAEVINADSMQVYKEMNIGTAKITKEEMNKIPHHLFSIKSVKDGYSIYEYQKDCRKKIDAILKKGKNVVIVGGSGLYIKSALYDYQFVEETSKDYNDLSDKEIINRLKKLKEIPNIDLNNRRRVKRYLEKIENNSIPPMRKNEKVYDFKIIGLTTDRDILYSIINNRVDVMMKNGLLEEVKTLYDKEIDCVVINTAIGYKELYKYFNEELDLEDAVELIKTNSRRYAKRQYTFFRNQFDDIKWIDVNFYNFNETIKEALDYFKGGDICE